MQLVPLRPLAFWLVPLPGSTPVRVLGATAKASPSWSHQQTALSWQSPTRVLPLTPLFSTGPCSWATSGASEIHEFFYIYTVLMSSFKLNVRGCCFLAELNCYLQISPVPVCTLLQSPPPPTFYHRELNHRNYARNFTFDMCVLRCKEYLWYSRTEDHHTNNTPQRLEPWVCKWGTKVQMRIFGLYPWFFSPFLLF